MFKKKQPQPSPRELPSNPVEFPVGTCVHTPKGWYYISGKATRFKIISETVLVTWAFYNVTETSDIAVSKYVIIGKLPFRPGTLIREKNTQEVYLMVSNKKCLVTSQEVLDRLGFTEEDILVVSNEEIMLQDEGEPIK